jgi:hypothetical protein
VVERNHARLIKPGLQQFSTTGHFLLDENGLSGKNHQIWWFFALLVIFKILEDS